MTSSVLDRPVETPVIIRASMSDRIEQAVFSCLLLLGSGALLGTAHTFGAAVAVCAYLIAVYTVALACWVLSCAFSGDLGPHAPANAGSVQNVLSD